MTVINTLDNVEQGQQISVGTGAGSVTWEWDGSQFFQVNNTSVRLARSYFEGGVAAGIVSTVDTPPLVVGGGMCLQRSHTNGRVEFWVVGGVTEGVAYTVHVRQDQSMELASITVDRLMALEVTDVSAEHSGPDRLIPKYQEIANDYTIAMRRVKQYETITSTQSARFDGLVSAVHAWMAGEEIEFCSDLDGILENAGADPRPGQDFTADCSVSVSGTTEVEIDHSTAADYVGGINSYDVNDVEYMTVNWSTTFTYELESEGGQCQCESADWHAIVADWASNEGISWDSLDHEVECDRCG